MILPAGVLTPLAAFTAVLKYKQSKTATRNRLAWCLTVNKHNAYLYELYCIRTVVERCSLQNKFIIESIDRGLYWSLNWIAIAIESCDFHAQSTNSGLSCIIEFRRCVGPLWLAIFSIVFYISINYCFLNFLQLNQLLLILLSLYFTPVAIASSVTASPLLRITQMYKNLWSQAKHRGTALLMWSWARTPSHWLRWPLSSTANTF